MQSLLCSWLESETRPLPKYTWETLSPILNIIATPCHKLFQHPAPALFALHGSRILAVCIFAQIQVQQNTVLA
ncbi:hypothetical protein [Proteus mirabilis]|uniref:hypothetical protein n=1 Tax=Proteus mirabilis TaxID=584 RepID=UPI000ACB7F51|nr:hypothetical protein [Proteus mirabilis]